MKTNLLELYTPKQIKSLQSNARILVLHGAKRTGKTYILIIKFLMLVSKFKNKNFKFIIGGASAATVRTNVLDDLEKIIGKEIILNKEKSFKLFGNKILVRAGSNSDSWKGVRGFTAHGALLNEGTALHDTFIKECISRCSGEGARIYIDTNPENPMHTIKLDYIDKSGQKLEDDSLNIEDINFKLSDNSFLDKKYVESIKLSTPTGMFYDRDIEGLWVNAQGVIYKDYIKAKHMLDITSLEECLEENEFIEEYVGGIDWGFEHYGSIVILAYTNNERYIVIEEYTRKGLYVEEYWLPLALKLNEKYKGIVFYCDTARPEYFRKMLEADLEIFNAKKSVVPGIETVGSLFKTDKLFICKKLEGTNGIDRLEIELSTYVWNNVLGKEEPLKVNDDALDALRYAIYSHKIKLSKGEYF